MVVRQTPLPPCPSHAFMSSLPAAAIQVKLAHVCLTCLGPPCPPLLLLQVELDPEDAEALSSMGPVVSMFAAAQMASNNMARDAANSRSVMALLSEPVINAEAVPVTSSSSSSGPPGGSSGSSGSSSGGGTGGGSSSSSGSSSPSSGASGAPPTKSNGNGNGSSGSGGYPAQVAVAFAGPGGPAGGPGAGSGEAPADGQLDQGD